LSGNAADFRRTIVSLFSTAKTHYGRWTGARGNVLVRQPLPLDPLPERFGLYPIAPGDDRTRVAVLDFDNHGDPPLPWKDLIDLARPVVKHLRALGHVPMPFRSTGGHGLHAWLAWDAPQKAALARATLVDAIEACGLEPGDKGVVAGQVEVFPKQDAVPADGWGACVDPPLAGKSVPLHPDTLEPTDLISALVTSRPLDGVVYHLPQERSRGPGWHEEVVRSALAAIPADDYGDWVTVLRSLRGGAARARVEARAIAEEWSRTSSKHVAREFDRKWDRGFPKERDGRGRSLGTLYWLAQKKFGWQRPAPPCCVERIRVQDSDPKLYLVTIVGHEDQEVPMRSADLGSKTHFVHRVLEAIDRLVAMPKPTELNRLLADAERIEADDDATTLGQFRNGLLLFLDEAMHPDKEELRMAHRAWRDDRTGRSWFKWRDLEAWYRRQRHYDLKHTEAFHYIRLLAGGKGTVDLGDYGKQTAWWVPLDPRERTPEPSAVKIPEGTKTPF